MNGSEQVPEFPADHRCEFDHDTTDGPRPGGSITVTEWCACGRAIQTYLDYVC